MIWLTRTPCAGCAATCGDWQYGLTEADDGELLVGYDAACPSCGRARAYLFELPERETDLDAFGGPEPSELVDAGQWLALADQLASRVPAANPGGYAELRALAAAAVDEVLKFIPPDAEAVPGWAFWTTEGTKIRDDQPGRFTRGRLEIVRQTYDGSVA